MAIIIFDGIVNENVFKKQPTKLLWILKEANDTTSTEGWDMRKFLRDRSVKEEGLFSYFKWRSTFGLICKISYGILDCEFTYEEINEFDDERLADVLDRIAYINIKKTSGGSVVDYDEFNHYFSKPDHILKVKEQINMINPNIAICGNTFHYLFPNVTDFDYNNDWIYRDNGITYVNGWHPNARIDHESYFDDIKRALQLL